MSGRHIVLIALGVWCGSALSSAPLGGSKQDAAARPATRTVWEGIYTEEQALRGQELYDVFCVNCHGTDMQGQGVDVPALADQRFAKRWDGRTIKDLFELMGQTMPEDRPGSLSQEAYSDLLSYILQVNGFPAGLTDLGHEAESLARVVFHRTAPASQQ